MKNIPYRFISPTLFKCIILFIYLVLYSLIFVIFSIPVSALDFIKMDGLEKEYLVCLENEAAAYNKTSDLMHFELDLGALCNRQRSDIYNFIISSDYSGRTDALISLYQYQERFARDEAIRIFKRLKKGL